MRFFLGIALLLIGGCGNGNGSGGVGDPCSTQDDCDDGLICLDDICQEQSTPDGDGDSDSDADGDSDGDGDVDGDADSDADGCERPCGALCCDEGQRCAYGGCIVDLGPCTSNDDCEGDSYCDADGICTPYETPEDVINDPDCERPIVIGEFVPDEQCRWDGAGHVGPYATWTHVYNAPMVADFNIDNDRDVLAPSVVISTFDSAAEGAVLRVLDGRTCEEQAALTDAANRLIYASDLAIGDLDGAADGRPEIVGASLSAPSMAGGLVAFKFDESLGTFLRLWYGRQCELPGEPRHIPNHFNDNNGPSLFDLDDDGVPEVLFDRFVYDANGCLLNPGGEYVEYLGLGLFSVVADVDLDGLPELVTARGVFAWDLATQSWVLEPYWSPPAEDVVEVGRSGFVAVADLGDFPGAVGDAPGHAEIVVASALALDSPPTSTGRVRVMSIGGEILFGPYDLPNEAGRSAGRGGPPTISDFDGDGRRELAVAGGSRYTVFDIDCDIDGETGPGCDRVAGLPRGVLWSRASQDHSSNVTGSSVFDFDADGVAEVVYGDECFLRIYAGTDGEVLFSQSASSGTGYEYPVIADVDGDYNTEIVVAMTRGVSCPATDPIFTRGTSTFESSTGIVILRDIEDRWAASRPIWNQHAYSITHVTDDGTVVRTRDWVPNHSVPELNNFRMNAQGALGTLGAADLTVALARAEDLCDVTTPDVTLAANVCNRGTNPVADGARVVFYDGDPDIGAPVACETTLPRLLEPGDCTEVSCAWTIPGGGTDEARDIVVVVDPDGDVFECRDGNNRGVIPDVYCGLI